MVAVGTVTVGLTPVVVVLVCVLVLALARARLLALAHVLVPVVVQVVDTAPKRPQDVPKEAAKTPGKTSCGLATNRSFSIAFRLRLLIRKTAEA